METLLDKHWHRIPTEEVASMLGVDPALGLDRFEVEKRIQHFGENRIQGKRQRGPLHRFLSQFHQPLVYILLAASLVTGLLREWVDSLVILGVVLANALVGFLQESKAVKALGALAASMRIGAEALRGGSETNLDAAQLVPGDVVLLRAGDKVPADLRLLSGRELLVDESALTGESVPVSKGPGVCRDDAVLADRTCMAYAGTLVAQGQGRGIVVATGNKTEVGRISSLLDQTRELETPLTRKISRFSHVLLAAILVLAVAGFVVGLLRGQPLAENFMAAVALAVGAIPEGLPAAVTIILALGVGRMAARKAVIRKLPAVETLGGTTVICSDKTGTLTENQMTVEAICSQGAAYRVTGTGYDPLGQVLPDADGPADTGPDPDPHPSPDEPGRDAALVECLRTGLLCNNARIIEKEGGREFEIQGDPTEAALQVSARKLGLDPDIQRQDYPRLDELPFESDRRYMATLHQAGDGRLVCVKGSVEALLSRCSRALDAQGEAVDLDAEAVARAQHRMASRGLRVLALAHKPVSPDAALEHDLLDSGLVFLGLQGMIDPPREEAKQAVAACQRAGIEVKMITGDHAVTARAIGDMLGLRGPHCERPGDCDCMEGREIAQLDDAALTEKAAEVEVFARVSPEQKLRLVMALQSRGQVCAMTGDGVNDAPALKQADIGIAMGRGGTEAAKEASDMILTDDNFATIEAAVEEGRGVFDNLVKFIAWTLPTNAGEGLVILAAILFGATLPILPVQILWINMTTAGFLGLMLAFEPKEPGIMERAPRRPGQPLLGPVILRRIILVSLLLLLLAFGMFQLELSLGASLDKARTMSVNVFVVVEAFYLLNTRSFTRSPLALGLWGNPWVLVGFAAMLGFQLLYTYAPFMNAVFSSAPIGLVDWLEIFAGGLLVFLLVEADKRWLTRSGNRRV